MNYLIRYSIYPSDKRIEEHLNNIINLVEPKGSLLYFIFMIQMEKLQKYKNCSPEKINY